jgi:acyl carrier protein
MSAAETPVTEITVIPPVIRHVIKLITPKQAGHVVDQDSLIGDLGFDSLTLAELAFALEDLFGLDAVTPERAMALRTVGDIISLIETAITRDVAQPPSAEAVQMLSAQYGQVWNPDN